MLLVHRPYIYSTIPLGMLKIGQDQEPGVQGAAFHDVDVLQRIRGCHHVSSGAPGDILTLPLGHVAYK